MTTLAMPILFKAAANILPSGPYSVRWHHLR